MPSTHKAQGSIPSTVKYMYIFFNLKNAKNSYSKVFEMEKVKT